MRADKSPMNTTLHKVPSTEFCRTIKKKKKRTVFSSLLLGYLVALSDELFASRETLCLRKDPAEEKVSIWDASRASSRKPTHHE